MAEITSPIKAIRAKCLDCCGTSNEVQLCPVTRCALYPFRFGKNPYITKRTLSEAQKEALKKGQDAAKAKKETRL